MQKVLVIVGPTASGKSALAIRLAKQFNGEIISADSRQVYKGLNIGTGKVTKKEKARIKHHLLDVALPKNVFTASDYVRLGEKVMAEIHERKCLPIVVGGTGFYIDALVGRIKLADVGPNALLRQKLSKKSGSELFAILTKKDPERAKKLTHSDQRNPVRLIRALEISAQQSHISNHHVTSFTRSNLVSKDTLWLGIMTDASVLREKIHQRLLARMKAGMVKEVRDLHKAGVSWKRLEAFGLEYRYVAQYLQKEISKVEMLQLLEAKIWNYAKRQMTYWRRNKDITWFDPRDTKQIDAAIRRWLEE